MSNLKAIVPLPHDIACEEHILGACMVDPDASGKLMLQVSPEMFYSPANAAAFAAVVELWNQKKPISSVSLARTMPADSLEAIGGEQGLLRIAAGPFVPEDAEYFAERVGEEYRRRQQILTAITMADAAWNHDMPQVQALARAHDALLRLQTKRQKSSSATPDEIIQGEEFDENSFFQRIEVFMEDPTAADQISGILTGWLFLDQLGGLRLSELVLALGDTSVGKSWFIAWLAWLLWKQGVPVHIVTTEMDREEVLERLIFMEAGVDPLAIRANNGATADERDRIRTAVQSFMNKNLVITDVGRIPLAVLQAEVVFQHRTLDTKVLLVDHIQHVQVPGLRPTDIAQRIDEVVGSLKALAMNEEMAVVAISHINRESSKGPLGKHSGKGGSSIEQDANVMLALTPVHWVVDSWKPFDTEDEERQFKQNNGYAHIRIDTTKRRKGSQPWEVRTLYWPEGGRWKKPEEVKQWA